MQCPAKLYLYMYNYIFKGVLLIFQMIDQQINFEVNAKFRFNIPYLVVQLVHYCLAAKRSWVQILALGLSSWTFHVGYSSFPHCKIMGVWLLGL